MTGDHPSGPAGAEWIIFAPAMALLIAALVFGGASRENSVGLMVVELAGVAALAPAALRLSRLRISRAALAALVILGLLIALPVIQLTPLAPNLWEHLPGRGPLAQAIALIGLPRTWRPMSLAPDETARAGLYLLAPAGMFLAGLQCGWRQREWLVMAVIGIALLSLAVGAIQAAGGEAGPLHLYANAAIGLPNGFFANRNHQSAFMVAAVALAASLSKADDQPIGRGRRSVVILVLMLLFAVGAAATLSRAGVLMIGPVLAGGLLVSRPKMRGGRMVPIGVIAVAVTGAVLMVLTLKGGVIFDRFENGGAGGGRLGLLPDVISLGKSMQPFGGGVGSFDLVYRAREPLERIDPFYLNHVHNDYVEGWLEAGWPAIGLFGGFAVWWGLLTFSRWSEPDRPGAAFARSGGLVTAALLLHSIVDYPLRTPALAVLFALGCALMLDPPRIKHGAAANGLAVDEPLPAQAHAR